MSNRTLKISFIGYGNIAKAIAKSLMGNAHYQLRAASPSLAAEINPDGLRTHYDNVAILSDADILILAVKPKIMPIVLSQINQGIPKHSLVVSVAAGLKLTWLAKHLPPHQAIVRGMPNIATAVLKGATPLIANSFVSKNQRDDVVQLFTNSGLTAWLDNENEMDIFTAISGSGPAYFFLFLEAMAKAGEKLGLPKDLSKAFTLQTMFGAAQLAQVSQLSFDELRKQVTSPGGTTAAAIEVFQQKNIEQIFFDAIAAACNRAKTIGEERK